MLDLSALRELLRRYGEEADHPVRNFDIGGRAFDFNRRRGLVGVINLSPDSGYPESIFATPEAAIAQGRRLAALGADLVDVGAESTLPDAERISPTEQKERLVPVVRALSQQGILVSVESYFAEVLEAAALAGACVFNLTGEREEREAFKLARRFEAAVVLCYVQGETVREAQNLEFGADQMEEIAQAFEERTALAAKLGVERCILDPGLGFYYENLRDGTLRVNHQLRTVLQTFRLNRLGFPTMNILPHAPEIFGETHRRSAEPFFAVLALLGGSHLLRTHELEVVACVREVMSAYRPDQGGP